MQVHQVFPSGFRFAVHDDTDGREVGRAFLYVLRNDLHPEPFGFVEDVFVDASARSSVI